MKKTLYLFAPVFALFIISCGGETNNNQATEQDSVQAAETTQMAQTTKPEASVAQAKFQMMIANTAGTSYIFNTQTGDELQLFPDQNLKGMEFANRLQPGSTDHKYFDKPFEIKYEKRSVQTTGGYMEDRLFLLDVKDHTNNSTSGLSLNDLKTIKFAGVEPAWTVEFRDDYVIYNFGYEENPIKMVYYGDHDGSNQRIKVISDTEVQVQFIHESALDKGYINTATIRKENCSDGMSDNTYPYSIKVQEEARVLSGCGRVVKTSGATSDFDAFWQKFQKIVAANDKQSFIKLCTPEMKNFFNSSPYENFVNDRMRQEVAKATVANVSDEGENGKLFYYTIVYSTDADTGEVFSSTFGFWFKKINGEWKIYQPQMGG